MRRRGKIQALLAVLMIVAMMIGSIPMDIVSVQAEEEPAEITAFDQPEIEITVEVGTKLEDISFPETLKAQIKGGESKDIPVTWEDAGQYNRDIAGTYPFVVKLGADYTFAGTLPEVKVTVAEAESQPEAAEETEAPTETPTATPAAEEAVADDREAHASETETEPVAYQNKISGFVWADKVLDGNYDPDAEDENNREWAIEGYQVYLLKVEDKSVVAETTTDVDGKYGFSNIEPGKYVVKPHYNTPDTGDYRRSRLGIVGQNKIEAATGTTAVLEVLADSVMEDQDIGMKVKPGYQLKASYTIDMSTVSAGGTGYTYAPPSGSIYNPSTVSFNTAATGNVYTITGNTTAKRIVVESGVTTELILDGVDIAGSNGNSPLLLMPTANVKLTLSGINTLTVSAAVGTTPVASAGLTVYPTSKLTIDGPDNSVLTARGRGFGPGIGGEGSGGTYLSPYSGYEKNGDITINGGTVEAYGGASAGAGIGAGGGGDGGNITINGGKVTAYSYGGAGIGAGGDVYAWPSGTAGAWGNHSGGTVIITGGEVEARGGSGPTNFGGAGIGGTGQGTGGTITITGGTVHAYSEGDYGGAGIGGGSSRYGGGSGGTIAISGGKVKARLNIAGFGGGAGIGGGHGILAIGGGASGNITISQTADVTIETSGVGTGGAGIGGGPRASVGNITISGGTVNIPSTMGGGAGIGGGYGSPAGGNIKITGGQVITGGGVWSNGVTKVGGGAGIGGGFTGSPAATLEIDAAAEIYAYSMTSANPALWATTITGSGYYVNAYFGDGPLSTMVDYDLRVHSGNYVGTYLDTIPLPAPYYCFAYTTGGSSRVYHTRGINTSTGMDEGQVVEYTTNDYNILTSKNGGSAASTANLYKVKLSGIPFLGNMWHDNVAQTTADLISKDHTFSLGTNRKGYFDYDLNGSFAPGYTRVPWSSTTTNPYTEHLTGLTPNSMYYYRNYLENEYGNTTSAVQKFLTLPQISSWNATGNTVSDSIVSGSITASGNNNPLTGVKVTIATDSGFTSGVQVKTLTSGASVNGYTNTSFTANFGVLTAGTYYVKVEVSNVSGALGGVTTETTSFVVASVYTITETYVGKGSGTKIDSVGLPDTSAYATSSYTPAAGIPPATHTVGGDTYTYQGYKLDSYTPGDPINSGTPSAVAVSGNRTVYYIYEVLVDVAISKTVTGTYGDPNKLFDIKVTLKDGSNAPVTSTYSYTGSAIGGVTPPVSGSITFNGSGEGTIRLKHGQTITLKDIPKGYTYTVQETDAAITSGLYDVSYSGTGTVTGSGASAVISQTLGSAIATVSVTNNRSTVPASGIKGSNYQMASVGILGVLVVAALMIFGYRRRRKCR